ncbi:L,D-transpeptidase family protein [Desulfovibrio sp.]|uniref:L,D-transpeptidase family protein n=1 Tax=Desulfovibrio sp. TaxID=885 RepID=UPI0025C5DA99|nr:L,D-transpeptidase family protein [Desulfovibrio sp.]
MPAERARGPRARMLMACALAACLLFGGALTAPPVLADNWQATLRNEGLPGKLVGVDKKHKTFHYFEKKSPLKLRYSYPCVTGQLDGDKQQVNDLKTPEGVYFVEYKIAGGLDFREYGGIAYTLNYPNPVDRLRGKTGHGIWIHSKGFDLVPTKGCVAIGLKDIAEVGPLLTPGTAVVLAEEFDAARQPAPDDGTAAELRGLMRDWSDAWAARSDALFDFYDAPAYSRATEDFGAFRRNKERLFKILSFIKIYNREIHALEGPGYWVTWSEQFYTASNLSTEGIRRLYWQKGDDGKFRIVGMEWTPRDVGMQADFKQGRLVAEAPRNVRTDAGGADPEMPVAPRLDMPEAPAVGAVAASAKPVAAASEQQPKAGPAIAAAAGEQLVAISDPLVPRKTPVAPPAEITWGSGRSMDARQGAPGAENAAPAVPAPPAPAETPATPPQEPAPAAATPQALTPAPQAAPVQEAPPAQEAAPEAFTAEDKAALARDVRAWNKAFAERSADIADFYDRKEYNRLPHALGVPRGPSYDSTMRALQREFRQPWMRVVEREPVLEYHYPVAVSRCEQMVVGPEGAVQGLRTLWWCKDADGEFRIVGSEFKHGEYGLAADYLELVSGEVSRAVEAWRKAWEGARVDDYMAYYTPDAVQGGRAGSRTIRSQKEGLWSRVKPTMVNLSGLRLAMDRRGIRADMTQAYADSAGRSDRGVKTLLLRYDGQGWRIQREDWAPEAPAR